MSIRERSRARLVLGALGGVVGCTLTFSCAAVVGALLHLDTPVARRVAAEEVTSLLASTFEGTITLDHVGHLGLDGASGVRARVRDPEGIAVLRVENLRAKLSVRGLVTSLLFGAGELDIALSEVTLDDADVNLDADANGAPRLVGAFALRDSTPSKPGARGVKLRIERARVKHAWVHGQLAAAPPIDADADALEGKVLIAPEQTTLEVTRLALVTRGMPNGANLRGDAQARLAMPSKAGHELGADAHFVGDIGGILTSADALVDGKQLDAVVDVRAAAAERVRALVPGAPVYEEVSAHADVHGELPILAVKAHARIGKGNADVDGAVTVGAGARVDAAVTATDVDVHAFSPDAPVSALGAAGEVHLATKEDGTLVGEFSLAFPPGSLGEAVVPAAHLAGDFAKTKAGLRVRAKGHVAERGAPTDLAVDLHAENEAGSNGEPILDFDVHTTVPSLEGITRIGPIARGRGRLHARGKLTLGDRVLDATLVLELEGLAKDGAALRHGTLRASATGALANPFLEATFEGEGLDAGGMKFAKVRVRSRGQARTPEVHARLESGDDRSPDVKLRASVGIGRVTTLSGVRVEIAKDDVVVEARAGAVRIAGGDVRVERGGIGGLGQPMTLEARLSNGELAVKAATKELDLAKLARLLNLEDRVEGGHLALDVDMAFRKSGAKGRLAFDLSGGTIKGLNAEARGHVDATVDGRTLSAVVRVQLGDAGHADVDASTLVLAGPPLDPRSWLRASGKAKLDAELDLGKAAALLPEGVLPVDELRGVLTVTGSVGRARADRNLDVELAARTRGLEVGGKSVPLARVGGTEVLAAPPWRVAGIDVGVDARVDAGTGRAVLAARLDDAHGALVSLDLGADLPYSELFARPDAAVTRLSTVPFTAKVSVPKRALDVLPALAGTKGMHGTIALELDAEGTLRRPKVALSVHAEGVKAARSPLTARFDTAVTAGYDGTVGDLRFTLATRRGQVVEGAAQVHARVDDLLDHADWATLPWDASLGVKVNRFPLQNITAVGDAQVKGMVSGEVTLTDLHKDARMTADLTVVELEVANAKYKGGSLTARIDDKAATATLRIDQADGYMAANAAVPLSWGARLVPELDGTRRFEAAMKAKQFRIAALQPFVEGTLDELDGKLDADVSVATGGGQAPKVGGRMKLVEGLVQSSVMGEEFHGVTATVDVHEGAIVVSDVVANGSTGRLEAKGRAKMNGLTFESAELEVRVPARHALPIAVEGVEVGEAYGDITLKAKAAPRGIAIAVDVPDWHTTLPDSSKHVVQPLEESEDVHIGVHRGEARSLVLLPMDAEDFEPSKKRAAGAMELTVNVHLGDDVEIKKGTGLKVAMDGDVAIQVTDRAHVAGHIRLKRGLLDVQGKRFEIEKGTVSFVGDDPANPQVVVTASWGAPDGTMIYADFVGPLKTGKVTLRSEPARPKNEILGLIVFGSADGLNGNPNQDRTSDTASQAVSAGGGVATQGLNAAIVDLTGMEDAQFRVDTSTNNPRPELEYQISKSIAVGVAYVMGVPPPDQPDFLFARADWRFLRNWSLVTMFGNFGSTVVDAVWQRRY